MSLVGPVSKKQAANRGRNVLFLLIKKSWLQSVWPPVVGGVLSLNLAYFNAKRRDLLRSAFRNALARSRAFSVVVMGVGIS